MKCIECGKEIPKWRKNKVRNYITCSKICSNLRDNTSTKNRKKP